MKINLNLISNFNIELLKRNIDAKNINFINEVKSSQYDQLYQSIFNFEENIDTINFIFSFPEAHIKSFRDALDFKEIKKSDLLKEIDEYAELIKNLSTKSKFVILPTWQKLPFYKSHGIMDWKSELGITRLITEMNLRLAENFSKISNIFLIDSSAWQLNSSENHNSKLWYLTKVPFQNNTFNSIANSLIKTIENLVFQSKKLIVIDLDNTIWGGLIGELSFEGINIGGHNFIGEAFKDFQKSLLALHNRGILLAVASKNEEHIALKAFEHNSEMILKKEHFTSIKINWDDKAKNIINISKEINIGLDSIVFIDDNPIEREQIKILLPDVLVPNWPKDPVDYAAKINSMRCFDKLSFTKDDKKRNKSYLDNQLRESLKVKHISKNDWLKELNTIAEVNLLNDINSRRVSQLFNKTNQFNLTTRRLTENQIKDFYSKKNNYLITIDVSDKFGELGLVGIIGLSLGEDNNIYINDLILSCRSMGRGIEETILYLISKKSQDLLAKKIIFKYKKTDKNQPIFYFLKKSKLRTIDNFLFTSNKFNIFTKPPSVKIIYK